MNVTRPTSHEAAGERYEIHAVISRTGGAVFLGRQGQPAPDRGFGPHNAVSKPGGEPSR